MRVEDGEMVWQTDKAMAHGPQVRYLRDGTLANVYGDSQLLDGRTGEPREGFTFNSDEFGKADIWHISVSPDEALLAVVRMRGSDISIWTKAPETLVTTLEGHLYPVECTCFSSDGNLLLSGSHDSTLRLWKCSSDTQTWTCVAIVYSHRSWVNQVAFLPHDKRIISIGSDCTVQIWDISAVIEGREFNIEVDEGTPSVVGNWFQHAIPLGGWFHGQLFVMEHRFKLPPGVEPLDWDIVSQKDESGVVEDATGARLPVIQT
jgi:hypothetical protein